MIISTFDKIKLFTVSLEEEEIMEEKKRRIRKSDSDINPAEETAKWDAQKWNEYRTETEKNMASGLNELASKLKAYRMLLRLSQEDFAAKIGVPAASYRNYENGHRYPKNMEIVNNAAIALGTTTAELLGESGGYIVDAGEKGNISDQRKMDEMVQQMSAMFAGGEIDEESKRLALEALTEAYWEHKVMNRQKYTPKKYRKDEESAED